MNLFVLDVMFSIFGIRAHIPGNDDFHGGPHNSSVAATSGKLMRILAVFAAFAALLSLLVWAAAWLTVKSL